MKLGLRAEIRSMGPRQVSHAKHQIKYISYKVARSFEQDDATLYAMVSPQII